MNWLRPLPPPDPEHAPYGIISRDPPIFYHPYWIDDQLIPRSSLEPIYRHLGNERAYFLFNWFWQMEAPKKIKAYRDIEEAHQAQYPGHRFIHLCNTTRQFQHFGDAGLDAVFCNQNCLVDENLFHPLPDIEKKFEAVYDGRFINYKRHHLASQISNLALIYDYLPTVDSKMKVTQLKEQFHKAHFFNHPEGGPYQRLSYEEINLCLNRCRAGLCLSGVEGAMYASIQYLLAGLPVITTHSEGGRDVMFDERFVLVAPATPQGIADTLSQYRHETPPPTLIRQRTLELMNIHRQRLIRLVQSIYDTEGTGRDFSQEWPKLFFNKLYHPRKNHRETIAELANR
ncbi:MAG: hypothetical protein C0616_06250 [Desulfuromonas sp.]|nr:MAG: hypothetical protein C0616_06250 [Desulfuromonas sp.]